MNRSKSTQLILAAGLLVSATLAGCSTPTSSAGTAAETSSGKLGPGVVDTSEVTGAIASDPSLAALVPADIKARGTLVVGSPATFPALNFYAADGTTLVGHDWDLAVAVAKRLGLRPEHSDIDYAALIPGLKSGRIDTLNAGMSDTAKRQQEIDFVDYRMDGVVFLVPEGNPDKVSKPDSLCGLSTAAVTGTITVDRARKWSDNCVAAGKKPIGLTETEDTSQMQSQLRSGRINFLPGDLATLSYIATSVNDGKAFDLIDDEIIDMKPTGFGFSKERKELTTAVQRALQSLIDDGTYAKIMKAWNLQDLEVKSSVINGGK